MLKKILICICLGALGCLSSCYQIHSDDDLRTTPVTNNPNIVPQNNSRMPIATH